MKKIIFISGFIALIFCSFVKDSSAVVLATYNWNAFLGGNRVGITDVDLDIFYNGAAILFDDLAIDTGSIGQTFTATSGTDANFSNFVSDLTNGINNLLTLGVVPGAVDINGVFIGSGISGASNMLEAGVWFGDASGLSGIDFQGMQIDSIQILINNLVINSPGSDPNGNGIWTDVQLNASVIVNGTAVPEPSTFLLFGFSLAGLFLKRFKFNQ